jgi:hypothetical protein
MFCNSALIAGPPFPVSPAIPFPEIVLMIPPPGAMLTVRFTEVVAVL